jgi:hypothetical protein
VSEEALAGIDQSAEPLTYYRAVEFELARVVNHEHARVLSSTLRRLAKVRGQDRIGCDAVISEEAVRRLELRVIERLGKALGRTVYDRRHQRGQTLGQAQVAEIGLGYFVGNGRSSSYSSRHAATGSRPAIPHKMCRIMRARYGAEPSSSTPHAPQARSSSRSRTLSSASLRN